MSEGQMLISLSSPNPGIEPATLQLQNLFSNYNFDLIIETKAERYDQNLTTQYRSSDIAHLNSLNL